MVKKMKTGICAGVMYKIVRTLVFFFPTEDLHYFSMNVLKGLCRWSWSRKLATWACKPEAAKPSVSGDQKAGQLAKELFGLSFRNPVGLGAGFDKNALYLRELEALGFGFVEIGTVTPLPQPGNDKPRLFRLRQDQALVNRMGFNNDGVKGIAGRLREWR